MKWPWPNFRKCHGLYQKRLKRTTINCQHNRVRAETWTLDPPHSKHEYWSVGHDVSFTVVFMTYFDSRGLFYSSEITPAPAGLTVNADLQVVLCCLKVIFPLLCIFLLNKTNRRTDFQFYWHCYSTCFGQPFCPSSGVLNHTSALVHFMQLCVPSYSW